MFSIAFITFAPVSVMSVGHIEALTKLIQRCLRRRHEGTPGRSERPGGLFNLFEQAQACTPLTPSFSKIEGLHGPRSETVVLRFGKLKDRRRRLLFSRQTPQCNTKTPCIRVFDSDQTEPADPRSLCLRFLTNTHQRALENPLRGTALQMLCALSQSSPTSLIQASERVEFSSAVFCLRIFSSPSGTYSSILKAKVSAKASAASGDLRPRFFISFLVSSFT